MIPRGTGPRFTKTPRWALALIAASLLGASPVSASAQTTLSYIRAQNNARIGEAVAGVGDFNGDGFGDVIVGSPNDAQGSRAFIIFGSMNEISSPLDPGLNDITEITGGGPGFGEAVADLGIVNNADIYSDIAITNPSASSVYVLFGSPSRDNIDVSNLGARGFEISGVGLLDEAGLTVSGVGDVNGDGFGDVLIGAPFATPYEYSYSGAAYVVFGKNGNQPVDLGNLAYSGEGMVIEGQDVDNFLGLSVAGAGNFNGDSFADFVIGAPGNSESGIRAGKAYVIFGGSNLPGRLPLNEINTANGISILGTEPYAEFGRTLANAIDFNGDTLFDVAIGAPYGDGINSDSGRAFVIFGNNSPSNRIDTDLSNSPFGITIDGAESGDLAGRSLAAAGDISGDGFFDLLIGAPNAAPFFSGPYGPIEGPSSGVVTVIEGSASPTNNTLDTINSGNRFLSTGTAGDQFGLGLSAVEFNGDSNPDFIVGAPYSDSNPYSNNGRVDIILGGTTPTPSPTVTPSPSITPSASVTPSPTQTPAPEPPDFIASDVGQSQDGFTINGRSAYAEEGNVVANAGDLNGDGFDDVVVTTEYGEFTAPVTVIFGKADQNPVEIAALNGEGFQISGFDSSIGLTAARAGDFNGDGIDDLLIGVPDAYNQVQLVFTGKAYVIFGAEDIGDIDVSAIAGDGIEILGNTSFSYFGNSVSTAGDFNNDNYDDVIIGAKYEGFYSGSAYVIFGTSSPADIDTNSLSGAGIRLEGEGYAGSSVSDAGDFNGDGFGDVIIGAPNASPSYGGVKGAQTKGEGFFGYQEGASHIVFGSASPTDLFLPSINPGEGVEIQGSQYYEQSGKFVSRAGDVNNDGYDDVIVGAPYHDTDSSNEGASYVVFGSAEVSVVPLADIEVYSYGFKITGPGAEACLGVSSDALGDINNDNFDDLIIGAPKADSNSQLSNGGVYIIFGKNDSVQIDTANLGDAGVLIGGTASDDELGSSVAGADLNGDSIRDAVFSAPYADPNGNSSGQAYVLFSESETGPLEILPAEVDFGAKPVVGGPSPIAPIIVTNLSDSGIEITSVYLTGANSEQFQLHSSFTGVLNPGLNVEFAVGFSPRNLGFYTADLVIETDNPQALVNTIPLSGYATNIDPVANNDSYTTLEDSTLSEGYLSLFLNDEDLDGGPFGLTAVLESAPANAESFTLNKDGSFEYTPGLNFNGFDSFDYSVDDGFTDSNVATVTIEVTPLVDPPLMQAVAGNGEQLTNQRMVSFTVTPDEMPDAPEYVDVSEVPGFQSFDSSVYTNNNGVYTISSPGDGPKDVYVRFRNSGGISTTHEFGILLDETPPAVDPAHPMTADVRANGVAGGLFDMTITVAFNEEIRTVTKSGGIPGLAPEAITVEGAEDYTVTIGTKDVKSAKSLTIWEITINGAASPGAEELLVGFHPGRVTDAAGNALDTESLTQTIPLATALHDWEILE